MASKKDLQYLEVMVSNHKGDWLTREIAEEYRKRALALPDTHGQLIGEKRELWKELIQKYGVTELEAVNILNGKLIDIIVYKYYRIRYQIPLNIKNEKRRDEKEELEDKYEE